MISPLFGAPASLAPTPPPPRSWLVMAGLLAAATGSSQLLDPHVSLTSQAMIYVLAVVIASYTLDWLSSIVCAVGATIALNFFFVPPRWTFEVDSREHFIALVVMLLVALTISHLANRVRRETELATLNAHRALQLQHLATQLANVSTPDEVLTLGRTALATAFAGPCALVPKPEDNTPLPDDPADPQVRDGLRCCLNEAAVLGPGTGRWPGLNAWYVPLGDRGNVVGAACVTPALASDMTGREHAQALCALLAQALWRMQLNNAVLAAQRESQRQHVQNTFLAAVSHDLRTPLAAIVGAATSLQTQRSRLSPEHQERLLDSIVCEASQLCTITDNTLQLVRLASTAQDLQRSWESVEEIVGAVLNRVRQRDPTRRIQCSVPESLPLLKVDPVLISQLIGNLLDNALKYSDITIDLTVRMSAEGMVISVKDRGPGIPEAECERIFQPYARHDQSGQRGVGLGLAVCRAIALAHRGNLTVRQRPGGGSHFSVTLPVEAQPEMEPT